MAAVTPVPLVENGCIHLINYQEADNSNKYENAAAKLKETFNRYYALALPTAQ